MIDWRARARMQQNAAREDASFVTFGPIAPGRGGIGANERHSQTPTAGSNSPSRPLGRFEGVGFRSITWVETPTIITQVIEVYASYHYNS